MKKYAIIIGLIGFLFTACNKTIPLKSEIITVADETEEWEIDIQYPRFLSSDNQVKQSCLKMNQKIQHFIDSLQTDFKTSTHDFYASLKDVDRDVPDWKCTLIAKDTVFIATDRYVSIGFETYSFLGGANGLNRYYAFNYDIQNQRFLSKDDILDATSQAEINNLLEEHFENPDSCFNKIPAFNNVTASHQNSPKFEY